MDEEKSTFTYINDDVLCRHIAAATHHVIYAAPAVSKSVADAILSFQGSCDDNSTRVIIDPDAEAIRLGFGDEKGLRLLVDHQVEVRKAPGIRIGVLISDTRAWVFSPTPRIILDQPNETVRNAIEVSVDYAKQILFALAPDVRVVKDEDILDEAILPANQTPEVGVEAVVIEDVKEIEEEIKENPPQKFDAARKVRVYQGYLQFVELSFKGCRIGGHKINIPQNLLGADEELRKRIKTTCNLIADKGRFSAKLQMIEFKVRHLRAEFVRSLGERYGTVILRRKRDEFDKKFAAASEELESLRKTIVADLESEIIDNRSKLTEMLVTGMRANPPLELKISGGDELDENFAREYIEAVLEKQTPSAEKLVGGLQLTRDFKDVTIEMLDDTEFNKLVVAAYPDEKFAKLYSEEETLGKKKSTDF